MIGFDTLVLGPCMAVFGQPVSYTPTGYAAPIVVTGIFQRGYSETAFGADGVPVMNRMPVLGVQQGQFPAGVVPSQGDTLVVAGLSYQVTAPEPDGRGHVLLKLKAVKP